MKTVEQVMRRDVPTIGPDRIVAEAVAIVSGQDINALPVTDAERLVGLITLRDLLRALPYRPVAEIMAREVVTTSREMPIAGAYAIMEDHGIGQLPVTDGDRLVGLITREDALRELGRPIDPLTDLPWATALRERAEQLLSTGQEVALIFLDMDNFGLVNKQLGHVTGDQLIETVAGVLRETVDSSRDLLCRYGGDEFAILTTRARDEAEALALRALEAIAAVRVPGDQSDTTLSASLGIAGGKRTAERHEVHSAATIDDLITMASLQSTQAKIAKARSLAPLPEVRPAGQPRLRLVRWDLAVEGTDATATVEVSLGAQRVAGEVQGSGLGTVPLRLLAEATVRAVNQVLPKGWVGAVDQVRVIQAPPDTLVVVTSLLGGVGVPSERHTGVCAVESDLGSAAVKATLHGLNRRLAQILA